MKRFKHISALALCFAAALLTSCIKEVVNPIENVVFEVNLTRAGGEASSQQGDKIKNIMVWAFDVNNNYQKAGWRTYTPADDTFTSISLHLPVTMCDPRGSVYRIVAVLNTDTFTDANDNVITLDRTTSYEDLINSRFVSEKIMQSAIDENPLPGNPAVMPIAHWCDVEVSEDNIHPNNCAKADLKVFRTVAKSQFSIVRKSDFDLKVKSLTIHSAAMPQEGITLSSSTPDQLVQVSAQPAWFANNKPAAASAGEIAVIDNTVTVTAAAGSAQLIGARFLYENSAACSFTDNAEYKPSGNGYYYKVVYEAAGQEHTRYVGIPYAVTRNHDYQVTASITADGQIDVAYTVAEWEDVKWSINFDAPQHSLLMTSPSDYAQAPTKAPTLYYSGANDATGAFVAYFKMDGPEGAKWKPTFVGSADKYAVDVYSRYDKDGNMIVSNEYTHKVTDFIAPKQGEYYKIVVRALNPDNIGGVVKLGIIYTPVWNPTTTPLVIINKGSQQNGLYYPYNDWSTGSANDNPDMFWVSIKQVQPNS